MSVAEFILSAPFWQAVVPSAINVAPNIALNLLTKFVRFFLFSLEPNERKSALYVLLLIGLDTVVDIALF